MMTGWRMVFRFGFHSPANLLMPWTYIHYLQPNITYYTTLGCEKHRIWPVVSEASDTTAPSDPMGLVELLFVSWKIKKKKEAVMNMFDINLFVFSIFWKWNFCLLNHRCEIQCFMWRHIGTTFWNICFSKTRTSAISSLPSFRDIHHGSD